MPSWCGAQLKHRSNFTFAFYKQFLIPASVVLSDYYTDLLDEAEVNNNSPGALGVVLTFDGPPSGNCAIINTARARLSKRHLYQHRKSNESQ
jgi:hypothetical protein